MSVEFHRLLELAAKWDALAEQLLDGTPDDNETGHAEGLREAADDLESLVRVSAPSVAEPAKECICRYSFSSDIGSELTRTPVPDCPMHGSPPAVEAKEPQ